MIGSAGPMARSAASRTTARSSDADGEVGDGRVAGAEDQVVVEDPLVERDADAGERQHPADDAPWPARRSWPAPISGKTEQRQEADMDGAHDLARHDEQTERRGQLERGEGDREPEQQAALAGSGKLSASGSWMPRSGAAAGA